HDRRLARVRNPWLGREVGKACRRRGQHGSVADVLLEEQRAPAARGREDLPMELRKDVGETARAGEQGGERIGVRPQGARRTAGPALSGVWSGHGSSGKARQANTLYVIDS